MVTESIDIVTENVVKYMIMSGHTVSTAESCTGGMIAETITGVSGASGCFPGGVCCYTEEMKMKILGVRRETLERYSVYSQETASEMSAGAMRLFGTDHAFGITGIAGPGGVSEEKPAGTVYVSVRSGDRELVRQLRLYEEYEDLTREKVRELSTLKAMQMMAELCGISES